MRGPGPQAGHPGLARRLLDREVGVGGGAGSLKRKLEQWQEADFIQHSSAHYATFQPAPRSTIALSYNADGRLLASTHGDHTVKLTCCQTNQLVRVLSGHRRTPWVVRFHPRKPGLLASGSLDHEVRLWDADTGQCIARHTFGKPIASLAFHVSADVLAIACGHKLYVWEYASVGKGPIIVLKTRRSMRAVHFHPHGLPLVLTAEVQDPSPTLELPPTLTEDGPYMAPRPAAAAALAAPAAASQQACTAEASTSAAAAADAPRVLRSIPALSAARAAAAAEPRTEAGNVHMLASPFLMAQSQGPALDASPACDCRAPLNLPQQGSTGLSTPMDQLNLAPSGPSASASQPAAQQQQVEVPAQVQVQQQPEQPRATAPGWVPPGSPALPPSMVPTGWELPFPTSLFAGGPAAAAAMAGLPAPQAGAGGDANWAAAAASLPHVMAAFSAAAWNIIGEEQPPRVRLKLWRFDQAKPTAPLESGGNLRLQISDAVLCSEMGVHFSPCGRFLAATTACRGPLPAPVGAPVAPTSPDLLLGEAPGGELSPPAALRPASSNLCDLSASLRAGILPGLPRQAAAHTATSLFEGSTTGIDSRSDASSEASMRPERVVFEVRQIAIGSNTPGEVLRAKRIRAAHCLTSVQFSPTCDHLLLAYGKKHMSLLRSLQADRGSVVPLHTILEVIRLQDMELVRVLPSADDEINAACFHPQPGGGLAYGTKEGRLRLVSHDRTAPPDGGRAKRSSSRQGMAALGSEEEAHPTERELEGLQQWVLTQQLLQSEAGTADGAAAAAVAVAGEGPVMPRQLAALQQLWQGRREPPAARQQ